MNWKNAGLVCALVSLAGCAGGDRSTPGVIRPSPLVASQPVTVNETQDAAFWIHPKDRAASLMLITNEKKGLEVHDFNGLLKKHLSPTVEPKYVDVLYDVPTSSSTKADLVLASCTGKDSMGVKVWKVDVEKSKLVDVTPGAPLKVSDAVDEPIGLCTARSVITGKCYFFVTKREGAFAQYELSFDADGHPATKLVRKAELKSEVKSCIADEELGYLYVAEDDIGVWRYPIEPDSKDSPKLVVKVGENELVPNVKGPAIYGASGKRGYLLVMSQGSKGGETFVNVYERAGDNKFVTKIIPAPGTLGEIDHGSGLAVTNEPTTSLFPKGVLAINDQINPNASEDFKLYSWEEIARQGGLIVDTTWSRRVASQRAARSTTVSW